jgi:hypothetical protein
MRAAALSASATAPTAGSLPGRRITTGRELSSRRANSPRVRPTSAAARYLRASTELFATRGAPRVGFVYADRRTRRAPCPARLRRLLSSQAAARALQSRPEPVSRFVASVGAAS